MRRITVSLLLAAAVAATLLFVAGLAIHATVRDEYRPLAPIFYGLPAPLLAGLAATLAVYWVRRRHRWLAIPLALGGVAALAMWFQEGWHWAPPTAARGALRVVQWNVDRPHWRLPGDIRWLQAQDADVITISERYPGKKNLLARWQAAFPDYQIVPSREEMLCLVRGEILSVDPGLLPHASHGTRLRTRIRGRELTILQVDIQAQPMVDRRRPLRRLTEIVATHRGENLLIAGDFNTPLESVHFVPFRGEAVNAFEAVGRGCAATWPRVPLLSLDQIWTNAHLRPVRCTLHASWRSDHRAVVAEFDFVP